MKYIKTFLSENFQILEVKFSIYLNRRVFVMFGTFANSVDPDQIPFNLSQPLFTDNVEGSTNQFNTL